MKLKQKRGFHPNQVRINKEDKSKDLASKEVNLLVKKKQAQGGDRFGRRWFPFTKPE